MISMSWWMRSRPVLVAAQKYAGIAAQTICSVDGTTNPTGLPGESGITYTKYHLLYYATRILQNPSNRLTAASMNIFSMPTKSMNCRTRKKTLPILLAGVYGTKRYVVSLTLAWIGSAPLLARTG